MRRALCCLAVLIVFLVPAGRAQTAVETLGVCLTDHTTGKERKLLARWVFTALAAHPEISGLAAVTPAEREEASQVAGALYTRLFTEACLTEVERAIEEGGSAAIEAGFGVLGQVAMQELMNDAQVSAAMELMVTYIDLTRLEEAIKKQ